MKKIKLKNWKQQAPGKVIQNLQRLTGTKIPSDYEEACECLDNSEVSDRFPFLFQHTTLFDYSVPLKSCFDPKGSVLDLIDSYFNEDPTAMFIAQDLLEPGVNGLYIIVRLGVDTLMSWIGDNMPNARAIICMRSGDCKLTVLIPLDGFQEESQS